MYVKYCENKPKSEFIVAEYIDTIFSVRIHALPPNDSYVSFPVAFQAISPQCAQRPSSITLRIIPCQH